MNTETRSRKKRLFNLLRAVFIIAAVLCPSPFIIFFVIKTSTSDQVYNSVEEIPSKRVAIVFGAGYWLNEEPSDVLRDRILTAVELYKKDKIEKIIMSGDNRFENYDEPSVMIEFAKKQGVPEEDLQPDYAGRRTYDTCYRAKHIFGLEEAILVTQKFHLTRAIYTCQGVGLDVIGMSADLMNYQNNAEMQMRDILALSLAIFDVNFRKPPVVLGDKIEISESPHIHSTPQKLSEKIIRR